MSLGHLDTLQLDRDTVADTHDFLVGYAEMCMRESGDFPPGGHVQDRQRVWARRVEAATSYFEASQWAMLTNPEEAIRLWGEAGRLYRELDFGFGYYLWVTTLGSAAADRQGEPDFTIADRLFTRLGDLDSTDRRPVGLPEPLRHPQQQTYLMLAGAIASVLIAGGPYREIGEYSGPLGSDFYSMVVRSHHYDGVIPVGALGFPVRMFWHLAATMMMPKDDSATAAAEMIGGLCGRYAEAVQQAMANLYLWRNGAAPVYVGSFEIAALVINAMRAFGRRATRDALAPVAAASSPFGRAQLEIALELTEVVDTDRGLG